MCDSQEKNFCLFLIVLNTVANTFHIHKQDVNKKLKEPFKNCNLYQLKDKSSGFKA